MLGRPQAPAGIGSFAINCQARSSLQGPPEARMTPLVALMVLRRRVIS
jgi:hypothetical protein